MTMTQIHPGQTIGHYEVVGFLGRGAFCEVFAAEDDRGGKFALKVGCDSGGGRYVPRFGEVTTQRDQARISPDETPAEALFLDPIEGAQAECLDADEVDSQLLAEANKLRAADGEGVVSLHEVIYTEDQRPVLVLEQLEGATLRERIRSLEGVKLRWLVDAVRIVEHHVSSGHWCCHGDIKPENLFITNDGQVRLIDPVPQSDHDDWMVATPHYNPFLEHGAKGDTQAFAIMLYELLTGALPFERVPWKFARTSEQACSQDERELDRAFFLGYIQAREVNPRAPRELEQLIFLSLCDDNFSLSDLRLALEDFLLRT
ncbi:MAG: hypothetical protein COB96_04850 [Planctomycetota bacterium]|nr:MAG: hypothetical protein COB96_04850 [Planctomycetota bacterium]